MRKSEKIGGRLEIGEQVKEALIGALSGLLWEAGSECADSWAGGLTLFISLSSSL